MQWFYFFLHIFFLCGEQWCADFLNTSHDSRLTLPDCRWGLCTVLNISHLSSVGSLVLILYSFSNGIVIFEAFTFFFFLIICGSFSSSISFKLVSSFGLWLCACVLTWEIPASLLTLSCSLHLSRKRICYQSLQARGCESTREPGAWDALPTRRIICASVLVKSRRWLASPGFCSSEWECFCLA